MQAVIEALASLVSASALHHPNKPSAYLGPAGVGPTFCVTRGENVHAVQDTVIEGRGEIGNCIIDR